MKIQAVVTLSTTEEPPPLDFSDQKTRETMAVVQRVIEDTGADTDTFCKWLMSSKVKVGGPLSGICHWFTSPERDSERRGSRYNILTQRHDLSRHEFDIMTSSGPQRTSTYSSSHINESTSISIIMILATVLFILLITAFVTCIIRKKRRPQTGLSQRSHTAAPMSAVVVRKDKPPDYNSVIMMKEREDEELPTYIQAVTQVTEVPGSDEAPDGPSERTESDDDSDGDIKTKAVTEGCSQESDQSKSSTLS